MAFSRKYNLQTLSCPGPGHAVLSRVPVMPICPVRPVSGIWFSIFSQPCWCSYPVQTTLSTALLTPLSRSCPISPVRPTCQKTVLVRSSCLGRVVLFQMSFPICHSCPIQVVLSLLCSGRPVLCFFLFYPSYTTPSVFSGCRFLAGLS